MDRVFCRPCRVHRVVHHHIVCEHQIEIEVWPANAEIYFQDERYADPANTQVRFDAVVYNAPTSRVLWQVTGPHGGPGAGSIDDTGLYKAPPKDSIPHGHTDLIVATSADNPLRRAFAQVVLIGRGPEPKPLPKLEISPKQIYLYYRQGDHSKGHYNEFIDESNTKQLFRAAIYHSGLTEVEWFVDGLSKKVGDAWYLYEASGSGPSKTVHIKAQLTGDTTVRDESEVILINYSWPGIVP